jgi:hypothetical protein
MQPIAQFTDNSGLTAKLTEDKIFISCTGQEETFALRGLSGIGIYDDIEGYNTQLQAVEKYEQEYQNSLKGNRGCGGAVIGLAILVIVLGFIMSGVFTVPLLVVGAITIVLGIIWYNQQPKIEEPPMPKMDSYFRIILVGGERKFKFDKNESTAVQIADFINKVENTLTAYK